mmetsp:Transcript_12659/g.18944  ORF Transcript_12659/g.18944 Transcript_12659/m.18944 type:complete len:273 (+) Transcript_12659:174-992(+)
MKPIILLIVIIINVAPHRANLLPNIIIFFFPLMRNIHSPKLYIRLGRTYHEPITFLPPRFPNRSNPIMELLNSINETKDLGTRFPTRLRPLFCRFMTCKIDKYLFSKHGHGSILFITLYLLFCKLERGWVCSESFFIVNVAELIVFVHGTTMRVFDVSICCIDVWEIYHFGSGNEAFVEGTQWFGGKFSKWCLVVISNRINTGIAIGFFDSNHLLFELGPNRLKLGKLLIHGNIDILGKPLKRPTHLQQSWIRQPSQFSVLFQILHRYPSPL